MLKFLEFFTGINLLKLVGLSVSILFYTFVVGYIIFVFNLIYRTVNIVVHLFDYFNSSPAGGNGDILCKFYGLLFCSGILDALQASQSFIVPAVTALFSAYGYRFTMSVKKSLQENIVNLTS